MKKLLLIILPSLITINLAAQCTVNNLAVHLKSVNSINGQCDVVFDFSWDQDVNAGNKFAYIHFWTTSIYPDLDANGLAYQNSSDYPTGTDLANALATIVIDSNGTVKPVIGNSYHPEPTVPVLWQGLAVVREPINSTWERMTVKNISLTIPVCTGTGLTADIWASQANNGKNVHCVSTNVSIIVGNPRITGLLYCQIPRHYSTQVSNVGDADITFTYKVYLDEGDNDYEPTAHDLLLTPTAVGPFTLTPGESYNSGMQGYLPWSGQTPDCNHNLWVEVTTAGFPNKTIYLIENTCAPLPVTFGSFSARRDRSSVQLAWRTLTEINNSGFEVQRKMAGGEFEAIAFVPSRAADGNSAAALDYEFSDLNTSAVVTEYRLKQIDLNGNFKYSDTRIVKGVGQREGITVFPNPVHGTIIKVVFDDVVAHYDISLYDANGRLLKQWKNVNEQQLNIDQPAGVYNLQFTNLSTNERTVRKIIVAR